MVKDRKLLQRRFPVGLLIKNLWQTHFIFLPITGRCLCRRKCCYDSFCVSCAGGMQVRRSGMWTSISTIQWWPYKQDKIIPVGSWECAVGRINGENAWTLFSYSKMYLCFARTKNELILLTSFTVFKKKQIIFYRTDNIDDSKLLQKKK